MRQKWMGLIGLLVGVAAMYAAMDAWRPGAAVRAAGTPTQIQHQGVVTVSGVRYSGSGAFKFAIVDPDSGLNRWTNDGTHLGAAAVPDAAVSLQVTAGVYSVRLGDTSITNMNAAIPASIFSDDNLRLRIWFDDGVHGPQQLAPDHPLVSSPYCLAIADGAVGLPQLAADVALVPVGTVVSTVLATAPPGWLLCDGSAVSRTTYAALFAGIGTSYGSGDGSTTFNVPDFRGRVPVGVGNGAGGGASGSGKPAGGSALSARGRGDWGGAETHVLSIAEMPSHNHQWLAGSGEAATIGGGTFPAARWDAGFNLTPPCSYTGGGGAHNNLQPFMAVNFIVKH